RRDATGQRSGAKADHSDAHRAMLAFAHRADHLSYRGTVVVVGDRHGWAGDRLAAFGRDHLGAMDGGTVHENTIATVVALEYFVNAKETAQPLTVVSVSRVKPDHSECESYGERGFRRIAEQRQRSNCQR